jgi:hypothetical protein
MTNTSTRSFQFRVTSVTGNSFNARTRQNIKKHVANIYYIKDPPSTAVKLAYVGSKELQPIANLFIGDRSDEIYANAKTSTVQEFIGLSGGNDISLVSENFLVTQEFVEAESGPIPLYYKHTLSTSIIPESIKVFDQDFNKISVDKYKLVLEPQYDEDTGTIVTDGSDNIIYDNYYIFNSLKSEYNSVTEEYSVYFVQYTSVTGLTEITNTELLNNEPAYTLAESTDYWYVTLDLKPWARVYILSDGLQLTLPAAQKYAVRYEEYNRISVKLPVGTSDENPWFPQVVNGRFKHVFAGHESDYSIAEFQNQSFNPIDPYKLAIRTPGVKISDRLAKLAHDDIRFGSLFSSLEVTFESNNIIQYAVTNDISIVGTYVYNFDGNRTEQDDGTFLTWSMDQLLSIDRLSGIVHVDFDILDSYDIFGTYTYEEKNYELTSLIMNPIFEPEAHQETRVIYITPKNTANNNNDQTESIRWLRVSSSGIIIETNQNNIGGNGDINFETILEDTDGFWINGVLDLHYSWTKNTQAQAQSPATVVEILPEADFYVVSTEGFPKTGWLRAKDTSGKMRYFKYDTRNDTSFELSATQIPTNGTINIDDEETVELVNFINERTILTDRDYEEELSAWGPGQNPLGGYDTYPSMFARYFVLGELSINPPHGVHDLSLIDVREDGGGIKEDKYEEAKQLNPEVQWFNDYGSFDGQIYPGKAVMVIKLPISLLDTYTLDNIRQIVSESVPYGVYPLIRFYGYEPRVLGVTPGTASVVIEWEKEGSEFVYDIWYSTKESGPFIRANDTRITDGAGTTNTYTVNELTKDTPYIVKITMSDKYFMWWYGYSGHSSIGGGLGLDETAPVAPFGNFANFQFRVII